MKGLRRARFNNLYGCRRFLIRSRYTLVHVADDRCVLGVWAGACSSARSIAQIMLPCLLRVDGLGLRSSRQQLPQHIMQNAAVGVIERLLRCVDPHHCLELGSALGANRDLATG